MHIPFYTKRLKQVGNSDRLVEGSTPRSFFMVPHKIPPVCGFSPSLRVMTLNPLPLFFSKSHKYNNYDKATYIVSSTLVYSLAPRSKVLHEIPTPNAQCKGCFSNSSPVSGIRFSNNLSISQVRVNIKETEHGTTFEIS